MSAAEITPRTETAPAVSGAVSTAVPAATVTPLHAGARAGALEPVPARRLNRAAVSALVKPPAVWSEPRPPLSHVWEYGRRGQYTGESGAWRRLGQLYALLALVLTGAGYLALWVIEHPARLAIAAVITTLAVLAF